MDLKFAKTDIDTKPKKVDVAKRQIDFILAEKI